jgi:predicted small lipoprotein YifL
MRRCISATIAVIALAVPLAGCGGGGGLSKVGEEAGKAAAGASKAAKGVKEDTQVFRDAHNHACTKPKIEEWSNTLQGEDSDGAPTC